MLGQVTAKKSAPAHNREYMAINTDTIAQKNCTIKFYISWVHKLSSVMYISSFNTTIGFLTLTQYSIRQAMKGKGRHWQLG